MLEIVNKKVKGLSTRIAVLSLLPIAAMLGQAQDTQTSDLKPLTLSMKWARGDPHYGPNFIWLSTPCRASDNVPCECTMEFKGIKSQAFADYISSFGDVPVPVVYQVSYNANGFAGSAQLESVGTWQADRFPRNDRLLGISLTFKG